MKQALGYVAKFATALVAAAGIALSQGLIEGTAAKWVAVIIGFAGAVGVYVVPNTLQPVPVPTNGTAPTITPPAA